MPAPVPGAVSGDMGRRNRACKTQYAQPVNGSLCAAPRGVLRGFRLFALFLAPVFGQGKGWRAAAVLHRLGHAALMAALGLLVALRIALRISLGVALNIALRILGCLLGLVLSLLCGRS